MEVCEKREKAWNGCSKHLCDHQTEKRHRWGKKYEMFNSSYSAFYLCFFSSSLCVRHFNHFSLLALVPIVMPLMYIHTNTLVSFSCFLLNNYIHTNVLIYSQLSNKRAFYDIESAPMHITPFKLSDLMAKQHTYKRMNMFTHNTYKHQHFI